MTGDAYCVLVQTDGKVVIGGNFTTVGGVTRNRLARLNTDGTLDTGFNPDVANPVGGGQVYSLALQSDGKILVGGSFSTVGGFPRAYLARLNTNGTVDIAFDARITGNQVNSIAVQTDGKIIIGGQFSYVNGTSLDGGIPRNNIARLLTGGGVDGAFNPGADNVVNCVALQSDGKVLLGGIFNTVGGVTRNKLARVNANGTLDIDFPNLVILTRQRNRG